jgi:hypothetical protein
VCARTGGDIVFVQTDRQSTSASGTSWSTSAARVEARFEARATRNSGGFRILERCGTAENHHCKAFSNLYAGFLKQAVMARRNLMSCMG